MDVKNTLLRSDTSLSPKLVDPLDNSIANCKQGSLRAVRYNGRKRSFFRLYIDSNNAVWENNLGNFF